MPDTDKTIKIDGKHHPVAEYGECIMCGSLLAPVAGNSGLLRCPVCGCTRKASLEIAPGNVIGGRYRILNRLGSGGSGELFFCYPLEEPAQRYVLKILKSPTPSHRKRFKREAEILAAVKGEPRIARILDFGEEGEAVYIVMEYISGKNLKQLREEYCMDEETVLQISLEVVRALWYLWENYSVIHRDIKPDNIMLDEQSQVKLVDFGISKRQFASQDTTITVAMSGLGTPGYLSPEQFVDSRNVDFRTDIFSLGATVCYLLSGKTPFAGKDTAEIYDNTVKNSPPRNFEFDTECSPGLRQLLCRMMQRLPEERIGSYRELAEEMEKLLHDLKD